MNDASTRKSLATIALFAALYGAVALYLDGLAFTLRHDERWFWPASLAFSHEWIPSLGTLRGYDRLSTPLAFVLFGSVEHLFRGGIAVGRWLNFTSAFLVTLAIAFREGVSRKRALLSAVGLLLFPYFLGTASHLYTDIPAASLGLLGLLLYRRDRWLLSGLSFALAIASRQYLVFLPVALLLDAWSRRDTRRGAWIAPLAAASTLLGWVALFGGLAPPAAVLGERIVTAPLLALEPSHALYSLVGVGFYFVLPERLLLGTRAPLVVSRRTVTVMLGLAVAFLAFPPRDNVAMGVPPTMGFFDIAARKAFPLEAARLVLYYGLAVAACLRFSRRDLSSRLVLTNAAVMLKSHVAWEKYLVPLLITLWYLAAADEIQNDDGGLPSRHFCSTGVGPLRRILESWRSP